MLIFVLIVLSVLLGVVAYALFVETRMFRVVHARMRMRDFSGKVSILHISDFHFKKGEEAKLRFLLELHRRPVDMVIVTGDMIDDNTGIDYCLEALTGFNATLGVLAVFGAHDHWNTHFWNVVKDLSLGVYHRGKPNDFSRLKRELEGAGIVCLENGSHRLSIPVINGDSPQKTGQSPSIRASSHDLWIVGVDDVFAGLGDFEKALAGVPRDVSRILLTHTIEDPKELAGYGFDAVFAGHSHGGQVRLPFLGAIITRSSLERKYASGVFEVDGTLFHLNNGIGTGKWTGFRFLCPPEATYIELTGFGNTD